MRRPYPFLQNSVHLFLLILTGIFPVCLAHPSFAIELEDTPELQQALKDLTTDVRVLCLAAHPDDDDYPLLAWLRFSKGYETHDVQVTRGDGGQNEIGPELYAELGVIRTVESQRAAQRVGAEYHNLALPDFGYSKSATETLQIWGHDYALGRFVWILRLLRPHVIFTHHGFLKDHGHHQAAALLLQEAFVAAADPNRYPEQLGPWVKPWQARKLYIRRWVGEGDLQIPVADIDPSNGVSYAEIGAEALREHISQGEWPEAGNPKPHEYVLVRSVPDGLSGTDLEEGLEPQKEDLSDFGEKKKSQILVLRDETSHLVEKILTSGSIQEGDWLNVLAGLRKKWLEQDDALCFHPVRLKMDAVFARTVPYDIVATRDITACGPEGQVIPPSFKVEGLAVRHEDMRKILARGEEAEVLSAHFEARRARDRQPASHRESMEQPCMNGLPLADHVREYDLGRFQFFVDVPVAINGIPDVWLSKVLPFATTPPVLPRFDRPVRIFPSGPPACRHVNLPVDLQSFDHRSRSYRVELIAPPGCPNITPIRDVTLTLDSATRTINFEIHVPGNLAPGDHPLKATVYRAGEPVASATSLLRVADIRVPKGLRVGIVKSYDDTLEAALSDLEVEHQVLTESDLASGDLTNYDTICLDIRAYAKRPDLREHNNRLLDYARNGGTLVVFYNKTFEWKSEYAPYPITLSHKRVTREDAPVRILAPDHPLLNQPNQLLPDDWNGWIQERGLYFPSEWAKEYTVLLSANDPGEAPLDGGYLVADFGKGSYIYTSYVWYRQLRAGHPGGYRAFANMIAYGKTHHGG